MAIPNAAADMEAPFRPAAFYGQPMCRGEYEQRRDNCTLQQLHELVSSAEYHNWVRESRSSDAGLWAGIALSGLLLACLLASQPWLVLKISRRLYELGTSSKGAETSGVQSVALLAEDLAVRLQTKEQELSSQKNKLARLEQSLWSAEHQLDLQQSTVVPSVKDILLASYTSTAREGSSSGRWMEYKGMVLLAALYGLAVAVLALHLHHRRRAVAAQEEARLLQAKIDDAIRARVASETEVTDIQARMSEKLSELSSATTAKHMAEQQVEDLQHRILELHRLSAKAGYPLGDGVEEEAEEERQAMVQELEALQQAVADRENELLSVRQDLTDLEDRLPREVQQKDEDVRQARQWLDQAQGQLQNTQTALNMKEKECHTLEEQVEQQRASAVHLQEALDAARQREEQLRNQQTKMKGEMQARVASVMDLMKTTRVSLSQKLLQSQATCAALTEELAARKATMNGSQNSSPQVEVLRESSGSFESFGRSPIGKQLSSSGKGENAAPITKTPEPGHLMAPQQAAFPKPLRSPYWFAKG